jgi:tetratricopeptide (TPR) repeat protein
MSGRVRTVSRKPVQASTLGARGRPAEAAGAREAGEPRTERILDLQRTAGNAAVVQMIGEEQLRNLRVGSTGDDVKDVQSTLNGRSDVPTALEVDGIFGPKTGKAVRELQAANAPLVVDGIVGPRTRAVLAVPGPTNKDALAKKVFSRGAAAYDRRDFAHAYDFFVRAHELSPRPGIVFSEGQALRRLGGRREEAIACYEAYLATGHESRRAEAQEHIAELRGPAATGVAEVDDAAARKEFERGAAMYDGHDFAHAYDQFTKAWELSHRAGLLFSRAQALRRLGGRDPEAISLYEQYLSSGGATRVEEAQQHIMDLRGPAATGIEEVDDAAARAIFEKGAVFYDKGDFAHAYDEFTRSWELCHRPGLQFSRAQALRRLGGRRDEAIALYEAYIASGAATRPDEAAWHIKELRTQGAEP